MTENFNEIVLQPSVLNLFSSFPSKIVQIIEQVINYSKCKIKSKIFGDLSHW
jgi:hypothetical protein